ncbi:MAG TPA: type IV pilus biogenesis/stability protein PilW [Burkholderiaceae bacterium]
MSVRRFMLLLAALLLAGCASTAPKELATASDQTTAQKRAEIRLQLAIGYFQQQQLTVALDEIKQALLADPTYADAYSMRALIYMQMNETALADENFQRALKLAPNNPDFSNNYGWFLCQNDRVAQAMPYFEIAIKSRNYSSPVKAMNNAGVCSLRANNPVAAERYFLLAFQAAPQDIGTSQNLAQLYFKRADFQRARFYVSRLTKSDTSEAVPADVLWLAIKIERKLGDRAAEAALAAQLRRLHAGSPAYAAYQRGAFDE